MKASELKVGQQVQIPRVRNLRPLHAGRYGVITAIHANAVDMTLRGSTGKAVRVPKMVFDAAT